MNSCAIALFACLFLAASFAQQATQLQYNIGQNYVYNVSGIVQNNGVVTSTQESTDGYYSFMTSSLVLQPTAENATCYEFVMNMFDTVVTVSNTSVGAGNTAVFDDALGDDVYFIQSKTGQVLEIIYDADDSPYYLNIKISVISALQTSIVGVGQSTTVDEADPSGVHSSLIQGAAGSADNSLLLVKTFSQADFTTFSDPNLGASNVNLGAKAQVSLDPTGFVTNAVLTQSVVFTDATPTQQVKQLLKGIKVGAFDNTTGFNMDLSSTGSLTFTYQPSTSYSSTIFGNKPVNPVNSDLFSYGVSAVQHAQLSASTIPDFQEALQSAVVNGAPVTVLRKLGRHMLANPEDATLLVQYMPSAILADVATRDRVFFIISVAQHETLLLKYGIFSTECNVRMRAVLAAVYFEKPSQQLLAVLRMVVQDPNPCSQEMQHVAQNILDRHLIGSAQKIQAGNFPYNVSLAKSLPVGGDIAGVTFNTNLFAGTNFDCNQNTFNFEVYGESDATASLFGYKQQALQAEIVYGQIGSTQLANQLTLSVWGKPVYQQAIPTLDCQSHTYPLGHTAPGFDLQYTVWISIIPVTFEAAVSLNLNLEWGWDVCTTGLTASVDVEGDADITISGSSTTDLLLLRAGFEIDASFNTALVPTAKVDGTQCEIGFEVDVDEQPMNADVTSYFQWRECKFLFFDCKWGNHNQQTWWSWSAPSKDYVLFQETYKIAQ